MLEHDSTLISTGLNKYSATIVVYSAIKKYGRRSPVRSLLTGGVRGREGCTGAGRENSSSVQLTCIEDSLSQDGTELGHDVIVLVVDDF